MKKYIIFDLDGTLINSNNNIKEIIFDFFREKQPEYYDVLRYSIDFKRLSNLKDLFVRVYWRFDDEIKIIHDSLYEKLNKENSKSQFIEWTIEKIKELWKDYKLYLSTWSSTLFAKEILKWWWVDEYFEVIQWSDVIPKSEEHFDIFKEHSWDNDFYKNAIAVGDSLKDEFFAEERKIDFILIWEKYKSISEIKEL